jgi:hypothetical protein
MKNTKVLSQESESKSANKHLRTGRLDRDTNSMPATDESMDIVRAETQIGQAMPGGGGMGS